MKRYAVHRAIVCSRSGFFDGACSSPFREAETGIIDLSEDDPEAVEHMVNCMRPQIFQQDLKPSAALLTISPADFYHLDYLNKLKSRRSSYRSSRPASPISPRSPTRRRSKKLNLALVEDPLLAMAAASAAANPLTPPDERINQFEWFDSSKLPDTPMEDQYTEEDPFENAFADQVPDSTQPHLVTHAKVYAIAEK